MQLADFKQMTSAEASLWMESIGQPAYRAKQIRSWIFDKGVCDFDLMTNISKPLRNILNDAAYITGIIEIGRQESTDGTLKFLFRLEDGHTIESVWIPDGKRYTLCVSTQVGCKLGCNFCLTGRSGFIRNLSSAEIVDQLIQVRNNTPNLKVTNVVLMGMGEPLDNYDSVLQALKVMTEPGDGLIGARKVTLSTAGVAPLIEQLAHDYPKIKLAVSLNAPDDETRNKIMPINKKYPIDTLMAAVSKWPLPRGRLITFEYVLINGINDSDQCAEKLSKLAIKVPCKINIIPYNPCPTLSYTRPSDERIASFIKIASKTGLMVFTRQSRGADILAACGQLRESFAI